MLLESDMQRFMTFNSKTGVSFLSVSAALLLLACGAKNHPDFPNNFDKIGDAGRIAYVMKTESPDSVARFICDAALGRIEGAKIDTLATATLYPYEHYKDEDLATFANAFDSYSQSQPLPDKMRLYAMAGQINPQQLGYQLGVEYINNIRNRKMTPDEIDVEIKELRKACSKDPETYRRFVKGFKVALTMEQGNGISQEIYNRFSNLAEE